LPTRFFFHYYLQAKILAYGGQNSARSLPTKNYLGYLRMILARAIHHQHSNCISLTSDSPIISKSSGLERQLGGDAGHPYTSAMLRKKTSSVSGSTWGGAGTRPFFSPFVPGLPTRHLAWLNRHSRTTTDLKKKCRPHIIFDET
jgi:hypothetical protein